MAVSESDLPQFSRGLQPIGAVNGTPIATRQQSGPLLKAVRSLMKSKSPAKPKARKSTTKGHRKTRGLESDNKLHVGNDSSKMSKYF
jgi:hypothetical protein